ncbi:O-antigen ligase family protein [Rhizobium terrae]|uniref:O-antigen ligase family protein n=1 Tax=Rhizobium terrae TaxID=2171756 RepID=UPI000E3D0781|nr:O-antigen ligase family protein [Rhizobium terrae]
MGERDWKIDALRGAIVFLYWTTIALALLNYGAVELSTVALYSIPMALALIFSTISLGVPASTKSAYWGVLALVTISIVWMLMQTLPLPGGLLSQPAWRDLQEFGIQGSATISLTPADDWPSVLRLFAPLLTFLLSLSLFDTDERALRALKILALSGAAIALFSIIQFTVAPKTLLFAEKPAYFDSLTGFFVNRNTAATYFGIVVILNFGLLTYLLQSLDWRRFLRTFEERRQLPDDQRSAMTWGLIYGVCVLLPLVALMLTKSRAGIGTSFIAFLLITITSILRPKIPRGTEIMRREAAVSYKKVIIAVLTAIAVSVLFFSLTGRALLRAEVQGLEDGRFCVLPGITSAIVDHFPFGTGLASFQEVFPGYRDPGCGITWVWNRAHNVYLEGLFGLGAAGILLPLMGLCLLLIFLVRGSKRRRRLHVIPEIGFASLLLVLLHSAFDFSLQISGFAIFLAATLGPIVTICLAPRTKASQRKRTQLNVQAQAQPARL